MIAGMGFGFSGEMIFLFFLALIVLGPKRLPEIGRQIGRIMNEFRRASNEFRAQIESEINVQDLKNTAQILPTIKQPLGSLASRIFNPPVAERETPAAKPLPAATPGNGAAAEQDVNTASAEAQAAVSPATPAKVAPDA